MTIDRRDLLVKAFSPSLYLLAAAILYAAVTLGLQYRADVPVWQARSPLGISTTLIASIGFVWTAILTVNSWRKPQLRAAWLAGCVGMGLIGIGESTDQLVGALGIQPLDYRLVILLWAVAAGALFRCVRPYAMHRDVSLVLGLGLTAQVTAHCLWMYKTGLLGGSAASHPALTLMVDSIELIAILTYISGLILTQVSPLKDYGFASDRVGAKARRIFSDFNLVRGCRYPTGSWWLQRAGLRHLVMLAMIIWYGARLSGRVKRESGRGIAAQFFGLFWMGFVEWVDPITYYLLELYGPRGFDRAQGCLTRYETKNGLTGTINRRAPGRLVSPFQMTDKIAFWQVCADHGLASAPILAIASQGIIELLVEPSALDCDLFVKRRRGRGAKGARTYRRVGPCTFVEPSGETIDLDGLIQEWQASSGNGDIIIQSKLSNAVGIADLAAQSLITFRVVTCLDRNGRPRVTHGIMRILAKLEPSWRRGPDGEFGAAIDLDTGCLGMLSGDEPESCWLWYDTQPFTKAPVAGRRIEAWDAIKQLALDAHEVFRGQVLVGWDIALTDQGPCLLEGNSNMDVALIQRCYRQPVGWSDLANPINDQLDGIVTSCLETRR